MLWFNCHKLRFVPLVMGTHQEVRLSQDLDIRRRYFMAMHAFPNMTSGAWLTALVSGLIGAFGVLAATYLAYRFQVRREEHQDTISFLKECHSPLIRYHNELCGYLEHIKSILAKVDGAELSDDAAKNEIRVDSNRIASCLREAVDRLQTFCLFYGSTNVQDFLTQATITARQLDILGAIPVPASFVNDVLKEASSTIDMLGKLMDSLQASSHRELLDSRKRM